MATQFHMIIIAAEDGELVDALLLYPCYLMATLRSNVEPGDCSENEPNPRQQAGVADRARAEEQEAPPQSTAPTVWNRPAQQPPADTPGGLSKPPAPGAAAGSKKRLF